MNDEDLFELKKETEELKEQVESLRNDLRTLTSSLCTKVLRCEEIVRLSEAFIHNQADINKIVKKFMKEHKNEEV